MNQKVHSYATTFCVEIIKENSGSTMESVANSILIDDELPQGSWVLRGRRIE